MSALFLLSFLLKNGQHLETTETSVVHGVLYRPRRAADEAVHENKGSPAGVRPAPVQAVGIRPSARPSL